MHGAVAKIPWGRRIAAVVALLAPLAALAVALSTVFSSPGWALLSALCVLVAVASAWTLVTRRGVARFLGGAVLVASVVGLIVVQILHWPNLLLSLLIIGLLAIFGGAGRYAIGRSPATARPQPAEPAERGVLIVNPRSGDGRAARFDLPAQASRRGIRVIMLEPGDDLRELAERAVAQGADVIGMAGGDGSQAIVAATASRHGIPHVCVPAGTRNHFALDIGLDRDDVVGALDAFTEGVERRIDLARVGEHVFVNNASLGVYAQVVRSDAYREAKLQTWVRLLPDMLGPGADPIDLQFEGPDGTRYRDAALVLVSNNPYDVADLRKAGTRPALDLGVLGVLTAGARRPDEVEAGAPDEPSQRNAGVITWTCQEFRVSSTAAVPVGIDGESVMIDPPVRFVSLPGALRIRLPSRSGGHSPGATVRLTRDDIMTLVTVAFGRTRGTSPRGARR